MAYFVIERPSQRLQNVCHKSRVKARYIQAARRVADVHYLREPKKNGSPVKLRSVCNQCNSAKVGTFLQSSEAFADKFIEGQMHRPERRLQ